MTRFLLPGAALLLSSLAALPVGAADDLPPQALVRVGSPRLRHIMANGASLAFSPDGKSLVSTGSDGQMRLWDVATGNLVRSFDGHRGIVRGVYFLAGGKQLLSGGGDNTVRLWDVATGKELRQVTLGPGGLYALLLSADQRKLLQVGSLGDVHELDLDGGKPRQVLKAVGGPAVVSALSPDGKLLAETRVGKTEVTLHDVASGNPVLRIPRGRQVLVQALAFSADGKELAFFGMSPTVTVWDVATGKPSPGRTDILTGAALAGAFSPDGRFLIGVNTSAQVWGAASGQVLRQLDLGHAQGGPKAFAQSPDGRLLAVADGHTIRLWDPAADRELFDRPDHTGEIIAARFTPDGARVTTVGTDLRACQWDAATGRRTFSTGQPSPFAQRVLLGGDGRTLVYNGPSGINVLRVGERGEGRPLTDGARGYFDPVAVSPDGRRLLCYTQNQSTRSDVVFDLDTGAEVGRVSLGQNSYSMAARALSPDNRTLAGVTYGTEPLRFWDVLGGTVPLVMHTDGPGFRVKGPPVFLCYSPDGKGLVLGTQDLALWEVATGRPRFRMKLQDGDFPGQSVFSADGTLLAVGTHLGAVHVFGTASGEELGRLSGGQGRITAMDFAPDGARLLSSSIDTTTIVWDVKEWRDRARPAKEEVRAEQLDNLWKDLADADPVKGYRAVLALSGSPKLAVPYLAERMPRVGPSTERIDLLIRDLDSDDFDTREKASTDLDALGVAALPALRRALDKTESAETRDRLTKLLQKHKDATIDLSEVRLVRSLEVLERIGTPEAIAALEAVAKIDAKWRLSTDAKAALGRLARRQAKP